MNRISIEQGLIELPEFVSSGIKLLQAGPTPSAAHRRGR